MKVKVRFLEYRDLQNGKLAIFETAFGEHVSGFLNKETFDRIAPSLVIGQVSVQDVQAYQTKNGGAGLAIAWPRASLDEELF